MNDMIGQCILTELIDAKTYALTCSKRHDNNWIKHHMDQKNFQD